MLVGMTGSGIGVGWVISLATCEKLVWNWDYVVKVVGMVVSVSKSVSTHAASILMFTVCKVLVEVVVVLVLRVMGRINFEVMLVNLVLRVVLRVG